MPNKSKSTASVETAVDQVSIYFPYTSRYPEDEGQMPDDGSGGGGEISYGPVTTLVTATADADAALGTQVYTDGSGQVQSQTVVVNDDFAYNNPTHIVGLNGIEPYVDPATTSSTNFAPGGPITTPGIPREVKQVYIGDVRCKKQYDALVSFTGNGGGSEIRFTRADGFLKFADGQVQADMYVSGDKTIDRWHIRKGRFDEYIIQWDSDWETDNLNENLAIYEEDNRNSVGISGSLTTTLKNTSGNTTVGGTIGFKNTYKSDDALITQTNLVRGTFFPLNRIDLEGEMYNGWPVRDKNSNVSYTLQDRTFIP